MNINNTPENDKRMKERHPEKTLGEILHIINRRKSILIITVLITLVLAGAYSFISKPVYESTVVLKKDKTPDSQAPTDLMSIVNMQSSDEIETEMELVETWNVYSKVIDNLNLYLYVDKIELPSGKHININKSLIDYYNPAYFNNPPENISLPQFVEVKLKDLNTSSKMYIEIAKDKTYRIYNAENDSLVKTTFDTNAGVFDLDKLNMVLYWPDAVPGSKVYFTIDNYYMTMEKLKSIVSLDHKIKTNVFTISVKNNSPYAAALIANTITEKFRDSRIEQQKQTIKYSFDFVDKQLEEMQEKLKEAERNLSEFKASGQIMTIDASSNELVKYLSDLEAEKMNTELQLTDYKNKLSDMKGQLQSSGYFDQSLLTPERNDIGGSPFASLMKQLSDLELQRLQLLQKRTENHPDVQAIDEQIKMVKQKLASYNQNTLTAYQIMINSLDKKLLQITNMMSKYEVKMERLPGQESKLAG
ncbi:MAG TPA: Wzz/FepE/Etk N-terminal domain-containing protein, partial [Ignavibacteriaceae bacterium]|nr:Wzz/FepE/Etk N-terminal domain-containing protein [Ignavibacteriaceae bacterium]